MRINPVKRVIMEACCNVAFRQRLIQSPKAVLAEEGIDVPDGVEVVVHEAHENKILAVLPGPQSAELRAKNETLPEGDVTDVLPALRLRWEGKVLVAEGRIDTQTAPFVKRELLRAFADVELDMAGVDFLGSAGLSALLVAQKHLVEHDHQLRLLDVSEPIRNVLELAGFLGLFEIVDPQELEQSILMTGWAPHGMPF